MQFYINTLKQQLSRFETYYEKLIAFTLPNSDNAKEHYFIQNSNPQMKVKTSKISSSNEIFIVRREK